LFHTPACPFPVRDFYGGNVDEDDPEIAHQRQIDAWRQHQPVTRTSTSSQQQVILRRNAINVEIILKVMQMIVMRIPLILVVRVVCQMNMNMKMTIQEQQEEQQRMQELDDHVRELYPYWVISPL
jgi:hypothetical protein